MSTQGLVTYMRNGKVAYKVIARCEGFNAERLSERLKAQGPYDLEQLWALALWEDFGCEDCLVVMDVNESLGGGELDPRYRATFGNPTFNPRWEHGTADYVVVVVADDAAGAGKGEK